MPWLSGIRENWLLDLHHLFPFQHCLLSSSLVSCTESGSQIFLLVFCRHPVLRRPYSNQYSTSLGSGSIGKARGCTCTPMSRMQNFGGLNLGGWVISVPPEGVKSRNFGDLTYSISCECPKGEDSSCHWAGDNVEWLIRTMTETRSSSFEIRSTSRMQPRTENPVYANEWQYGCTIFIFLAGPAIV